MRLLTSEGIQGIESAFNSFMEQEDEVEQGILLSSEASWSGESYCLELFPDGTHRTLWSKMVGNKYDSPGTILSFPVLSDSEYDSSEDQEHFFDNAVDALKQKFQQWKSDTLSAVEYLQANPI